MNRPDPAALRRLYLTDGRTLANVAQALGCSVDMVRRGLIAAGIPRRPSGSGRRGPRRPAPARALLARFQAAGPGWTVSRVAEALGRPAPLVLLWLRGTVEPPADVAAALDALLP